MNSSNPRRLILFSVLLMLSIMWRDRLPTRAWLYSSCSPWISVLQLTHAGSTCSLFIMCAELMVRPFNALQYCHVTTKLCKSVSHVMLRLSLLRWLSNNIVRYEVIAKHSLWFRWSIQSSYQDGRFSWFVPWNTGYHIWLVVSQLPCLCNNTKRWPHNHICLHIDTNSSGGWSQPEREYHNVNDGQSIGTARSTRSAVLAIGRASIRSKSEEYSQYTDEAFEERQGCARYGYRSFGTFVTPPAISEESHPVSTRHSYQFTHLIR